MRKSGLADCKIWTCVGALLVALLCASSVWSAPADYDGLYAGTYNGDDNGFWVSGADSTDIDAGYWYLLYSTQNSDVNGGDFTYIEANDEATLSGNSYFYNTSVSITVSSTTGTVEGLWDNPTNGDDGAIRGDKVTSCQDSGNYTGTYTGDDSGTWSMSINDECLVTGTITSDDDTIDIEGAAHPSGYVMFIGDGGFSFRIVGGGSIAKGIISGVWKTVGGDEGTFTSEDDNDDEATCFIQSLY